MCYTLSTCPEPDFPSFITVVALVGSGVLSMSYLFIRQTPCNLITLYFNYYKYFTKGMIMKIYISLAVAMLMCVVAVIGSLNAPGSILRYLEININPMKCVL